MPPTANVFEPCGMHCAPLRDMTTPTHPPTEPGDAVAGPGARARDAAAQSDARFFDSELELLPGVTIPIRSMLVRTGGDTILISPVGSNEERVAVGNELTALVAPDLLHHRFFGTAIQRYQPGSLWAPPGFTEKLPDFAPVRVFGDDTWPYRGILDYLQLEGAPSKNEVVFLHHATRTLYVADLFFHITRPKGFLTPLTFRLMGIHKRFAVARILKRWVRDPDEFQRSIERMLAWDFDRIVMGHGDIVERDARGLAERALRERGFLSHSTQA